MVALAVSSVLASRSVGRRGRVVGDQLLGFVYVGAGAIVLLALVVLLVGLVDDRAARAEGLAMFGLFTYAIYLLAAFVIHRLRARDRAT